MEKTYTGTCYIGVVGGEIENGECRDTISNILRREGDTMRFIRGTKGYESRQMHLNNWQTTEHSFILLLDHDMKYPPDILEKLRAHGLPYISGLYMRRRYSPIGPVWYEYGPPGVMPMTPWTDPIEPGKLYKLGASGWGCLLMHRDVLTATQKLLKGEREVIEDDMDIYPYDLDVIMDALGQLDHAESEKQIRSLVRILKQEIRPLRCEKSDIVGSDIRFPFFARLAGFDLYGDSGARCDHMLNYPLSPDEWDNASAQAINNTKAAVLNGIERDRQAIQEKQVRYEAYSHR